MLFDLTVVPQLSYFQGELCGSKSCDSEYLISGQGWMAPFAAQPNAKRRVLE